MTGHTKTWFMCAAVAALTSFASTSHAQREIGHIEHVPGETPQHFELELRFGPYTPKIDEEPALGGKTPYKDTFGSLKRLMFAVEFDWQAVRIPYLGTLGPGLSVGYTQMSDNSFRTNGTRSQEETSLNIYPFYGLAVLRADALWKSYNIPFVPYGKLGAGYAIWSATNPGGVSSTPLPSGDSLRARGGTWGVHGALGLSFAMDVLDRGAQRNLDTSVGINHTYMWAEYYWSELNGIGQSNALRVGARSWAAGLAFEF